MAGVTEKKIEYVALTGLNFKDGKRERRIEAGDDVPAGLSQTDINDLLEIRAITPKGGDKK